MGTENEKVVLPDGLGTTRATVDGVQAVTSTFTTEAFGNTVAQWGSSANPYRFAGAWGYRDDGDAGLLHVGARYYDPQVGRFLSRDALRSEHPYLYCEHEPVNRVDPSGMCDVTGWLGRTLQLDFRFSREDWRQIADGIDRMANFEIGLGVVLAGPVPGAIDRILPPPKRGRGRPPKLVPAPPSDISAGVGVGLIFGGG